MTADRLGSVLVHIKVLAYSWNGSPEYSVGESSNHL